MRAEDCGSSPAIAPRRVAWRVTAACPPLCPVPLQNILAWVAAGGIAYALYVVPEKQRNEEQQVGLPTQAGRVWQPSAGALHAYLPPQLSYQTCNTCCCSA